MILRATQKGFTALSKSEIEGKPLGGSNSQSSKWYSLVSPYPYGMSQYSTSAGDIEGTVCSKGCDTSLFLDVIMWEWAPKTKASTSALEMSSWM